MQIAVVLKIRFEHLLLTQKFFWQLQMQLE